MLLDIQHLSLGYGGRDVIKDVSLALYRGEKIAILGASGVGKSTLLAHIHRDLSNEAALCSQSQGLVESLSVFHNIYMGALDRHAMFYNLANLVWPLAARLNEIRDLCSELELDVEPSTLVSSLSGGQRQRVAVARALYQQRQIFLGDEPVSALDPSMAGRVLNHIIHRHDTVIMVLHNRQQALKHFSRILGLVNGRLVLDSPASAVSTADLDRFYLKNVHDSAGVTW